MYLGVHHSTSYGDYVTKLDHTAKNIFIVLAQNLVRKEFQKQHLKSSSLFLVDDLYWYQSFTKYRMKYISDSKNVMMGLWNILLITEVWKKGIWVTNITSITFHSILLPPPQWQYSFLHLVIHSKHLLNYIYILDTILGPEYRWARETRSLPSWSYSLQSNNQ